LQKEEFPVAHLSEDDLSKLQSIENELRSKTGEEIVLIAYKNEDLLVEKD
jgi:hypothetical protein